MLNFYHIRQEFRFKPGLKPDQTGGSGSGSALILNQTGGSVSSSAKKVPNWTKPDFGNTIPDLPPPHKDGWQPHYVDEVCLSMPMLQDGPKMWAMWLDQHPDKRLCGIVVMPDGCVSMRGICGIQLIKQRKP